ncbi:DNA internalization-related competence protein ComEC/Rec2 [soil metagenome]
MNWGVMPGDMENNKEQEVRARSTWAPALAGFIAGSALQLQQPELYSAWAYGVMLAAGIAGWALIIRKSRVTRWHQMLALLTCSVLAFSASGLRSGVFQAQALEPGMQGRDVSITGLIAAMPQRSEEGVRFRFEVESAHAGDTELTLPPQIYLGWYAGFGDNIADASRQPADLRAGERWQMTVRLKSPHGASNPHGFDYELWMWEQGLQASGYVRAGPKDTQPIRIGQTWQHPVERARQAVRDSIFARVPDRKAAGIIAALVTGDQGAIERSDWDIFRATGVAHLMSISGLHITMFAWVAAALVGWLWRRSDVLGVSLCLRFPAPSAGLIGGVMLATLYAVFSGWGVPSQRTVWMLATAGLLRLGGRRWPWPLVWLLTCAVVVAVDPWALMQAGFWLSFVAVGVLFAADPGGHDAGAHDTDDGGQRAAMSGRLRAAVHEQWVVTVALTPLSLLLFGQVSVVGLLANALAIPCVTLLITPLAMGGVAWAPLWDAAGWCLQWLGMYLQWLASWPFAALSMPAPALWAGVAGVAGGVLLALRLPWGMRLLGVPLLLPALLWQAPRPDAGQFELLAADIGQGNAVIVRTASHTLVYDTGPRLGRDSDAGNRVLVPLLRATDEKVDVVMLSHRDVDHIGGAPAVLAMQPQARLVSSIEDGHELQALRKSTRCVAGQNWNWDGVRFEVLQPQAADYDAKLKSNGMSCVLRIEASAGPARSPADALRRPSGPVALLVGDIEEPQELRLVQQGAKLQADVLLVPHHGSKTSSSPAFVNAVEPHIALVQAGYRNRYGHPAEPVTARYIERKVMLVDSPHCGAAGWTSARPTQVSCHRADAQRYWHHRFP